MDKKTRSLIGGYLDKADAKLKVAKSLLKMKDYEDAVSRAYYAAFHSAPVSPHLLVFALNAGDKPSMMLNSLKDFVHEGAVHHQDHAGSEECPIADQRSRRLGVTQIPKWENGFYPLTRGFV